MYVYTHIYLLFYHKNELFLQELNSYVFFCLDFENRSPEDSASVHIINFDIQDNHEEATIGAFHICEFMSLVCPSHNINF